VAVGGFDEEIRSSEDVEMFLRLGLKGRFVLAPDVVALKRTHAGQVRFADGAEVQIGYRKRFVEALDPGSRDRAKMLIKTAHRWRTADVHYAHGDPRSSLKGYLQTARVGDFRRSPVLRTYLVKDVAKSLVGSVVVTLLGERLTKKGRDLFRRFSRKILKRHPTAERGMWGQ
jgi:hypothetical protein